MILVSSVEDKVCSKCKIRKPLTDFWKQRKAKNAACKLCAGKSSNNWRKKKTDTISGYLELSLSRIKSRVKDSSRECLINFDDLITLYLKQQGKCALSGIELTYTQLQGRVHTNLSIDRIDSTKAYTPDNIQLVAWIVNSMKNNLKQDDFINLCKLISNKNDI